MRIAAKIRALKPYRHGEQPQATDIIKLNTNEAAYPPSRQVMSVLKQIRPEQLRRYPDAEFRALRIELAALYGTTPEHIFVGNGSDEILALVTRAFVEDNERIGSLTPSYSLYPALASIRGVTWQGFTYDELAKSAIPNDVSLFLWTNPNNPTGISVPSAVLAAFAKKFPGVVLIDEAYAEYAARNCLSLATAPRNRNVLVMRTFSKAYALAGVRIGYCIGPRDLIAALYRIKDSYNVDALAQHLALAAVRDQKGLKSIVSRVIRTRTWFAAELARRGWDVIPSEANYVFARPPAATAKQAGTSAKRIFESLRQQNIYVRYFPGAATGDRVRITIGTDAQMKRVLDALEHFNPINKH